jgi:hypothetical protein
VSARHVLLALALLSFAGCEIPDSSATVVTSCPDRAGFTNVSSFMAVGCGTIDCHGTPPRPLIVTGYAGLRLATSDVPGGNPTTQAEVDTTWHSVCGLEPELMNQVTAGQQPPDALLVLQKPLLQTNHKGGAVIAPGDDGWTCLTTWIEGHADATACEAAAASQER